MAQQLGKLSALPEDQGLIHSTQMDSQLSVTQVPGDPTPSQTEIQTKHKCTLKKKKERKN